MINFNKEANEIKDELIAIRRDLHMHPELGFEEVRTSGVIKEFLKENNIPYIEVAKTGVCGIITGTKDGEGKVVALRGDIDALPIVERTNLDYASSNGAMHACGHDFHQTSLLGAAEILKEREAELNGTVRLIFQPAEENFQGGYKVIEAGGLENVSAIIGYHNNPHLKPGQIGLRSGAIMAGVEQFKVIVNGVSAHAARPDLGVDTVLVITTIINNLQNIVSRTVSPFESAVLSVTHIDVGTTWNVLPANGYFEGTIRSFNPSVQRDLKAHFISIIRHIAESLEVDVAFEWGVTPPVTFNDEELTQVVWEASQGLAEVIPANPSTAGEDFAFYQERIPGVFAFIGSNGEPDAPDLHHDHMTIDDAAFEVSVPYYVENAQALLRYFKAKEV